VRVATKGFFFCETVEFLGAAAPEHDAVLQVAHQHWRQVQQTGLLFQRFFRLFFLGDVPQDHGIDALPAKFNVRNRRFHGKFIAISSHAVNAFALAHHAAVNFGFSKLPDVLLVTATITLRNQLVKRAPQGFGLRAAEHPLRRGIEQNNVLRLVHGDHSAQRGMDDRRESRFPAADLLFDVPAVAGILQESVPQNAPVREPLRNRAPLHPDFSLARMVHAIFTGPRSQPGCALFDVLAHARKVIRVDEIENTCAVHGQLFGRNSVNLFNRRVAIGEAAGPVAS
jgi:hypothetical protein